MYTIIPVKDFIGCPWDQIKSPKWIGYRFVVALDLRKFEEMKDESLQSYNAYGYTLQMYATCTTEEAAIAAKRLLEL